MAARRPQTSPGSYAGCMTDPLDFLAVDGLLDADERDIRDTVRAFARRGARAVRRRLVRAGHPARRPRSRGSASSACWACTWRATAAPAPAPTAYGVACRELEAVDSGLRSFVSVQGSLAMFAIHRWGTEEHKEEWLPRMATGEALGCFGLTEPDAGSDPGVDAHPRASATATTGCSTAPRCGSPTAPWPRSPWSGRRPTTGSAASWCRPRRPGFTATKIQRKLSLRASVTAELSFDDLRLPGDAVFPEVRGLKGPLGCLNEARYGILWGAVGAARACYAEALEYSLRARASSASRWRRSSSPRRSSRRWSSRSTTPPSPRCRSAGSRTRATLSPAQVSYGKLANVRAAARRGADRADDARRRRDHPGPHGHAAHEQPRDGDDLRGHRGDAHAQRGRRDHRDPRLPRAFR